VNALPGTAPETPTLEGLRACFEGAAPAMMATCAPDGTPNLSYLSQIQYVDAEHVALSFQFFNKTRANLLANPATQVLVPHPDTAAMFRLDLRYLRTETAGPLFEVMRAKLAGIASQTGMADVFRLRGVDLHRVTRIVQLTRGRTPTLAPGAAARSLAALRFASARLASAADLSTLLDGTLAALAEAFGIAHAMVLLLDRRADRLYTVASRGYASSGAGAEIPMGAGLVGVAARERVPIRINHHAAEYSYFHAIRESIERSGDVDRLETAIPLPGLRQSRSQLAVPMVAAGRLLGVLFVESPEDHRFGYDDEDALVALGAQLAATMSLLQETGSGDAESEPGLASAPGMPPPRIVPFAQRDAPPSSQPCLPASHRSSAPHPGDLLAPLPLRRYTHDDSVFLGDEYLIKGVAGAVLWLMLSDHAAHGRVAFSNRELRLDPRLRLPDVADNLEARLVLLQRRLVDRGAPIRLERAGRGRLRLEVGRALQLIEVA